MTLTSMKIPKGKSEFGEVTVASKRKQEGPKYPWGLRLDLTDISLKKLGISIDDFDVGSEIFISGKARVVSIRKSSDEDGQKENMVVQIEKMKLGSDEDADKLDWDTHPEDAEKIMRKKHIM